MGGVSGVRPAGAWIATGIEEEVTVVDKNLDKLRPIDQMMRSRIVTLMSDHLTLEQPVREEGVVHYCVGSMPGAVPNTSTYALTNVTASSVIPGAGEP